ncbi:unnamed protein product, partial [Phaeothamnion confervicola]
QLRQRDFDVAKLEAKMEELRSSVGAKAGADADDAAAGEGEEGEGPEEAATTAAASEASPQAWSRGEPHDGAAERERRAAAQRTEEQLRSLVDAAFYIKGAIRCLGTRVSEEEGVVYSRQMLKAAVSYLFEVAAGDAAATEAIGRTLAVKEYHAWAALAQQQVQAQIQAQAHAQVQAHVQAPIPASPPHGAIGPPPTVSRAPGPAARA